MHEMKVYLPNGNLIFETTNDELFYPEETCRDMRNAGYKVTLDGRLYPQLKKGRVKNERN